MITINNKEQLIKNGGTRLNRKARTLALRSLESALNAIDPKKIIKSKLSLKDPKLEINGYSFDLKKFRNIYVVGGGKASGPMAEALEQILGKRITAGFVNILHGSKHKTKIVELHEASHPIPDQSGVEGTQRMLEIAEQSKKDDFVICLVSGGGSSLMPLPRGQI
ncbi:MAG: glycerate-2-kinase family protein, partial [Candidatus Bathyarchaeota archaeon]|nr:glycerate-2-kinase family protein [Candidatus Bathyarchaeota archaeon]